MSTEEESRIRELFHQLKEEDEVSAPSFSQVLDVHRRKDSGGFVWSFRLKVAVSLLVVIVLSVPVLIHLTQSPVEPAGEVAIDLLEWESPTDFLLTFSEQSLWTTLPTVETELPLWVEELHEE